MDRFLKSIKTKNGGATAKLRRTVLSGMLGLATRMGALGGNPLRDVSSIHIEHLEVKALSVADVATLRNGLRAWQLDSKASGRKWPTDLLDVVDLMLATGARIGKILALRWSDVDLGAEAPVLKIQGTVVNLPGHGVQLQDHPKSTTSRQRYRLPGFPQPC